MNASETQRKYCDDKHYYAHPHNFDWSTEKSTHKEMPTAFRIDCTNFSDELTNHVRDWCKKTSAEFGEDGQFLFVKRSKDTSARNIYKSLFTMASRTWKCSLPHGSKWIAPVDLEPAKETSMHLQPEEHDELVAAVEFKSAFPGCAYDVYTSILPPDFAHRSQLMLAEMAR